MCGELGKRDTLLVNFCVARACGGARANQPVAADISPHGKMEWIDIFARMRVHWHRSWVRACGPRPKFRFSNRVRLRANAEMKFF
jgi:hypothetical protein